MGTAKVTSDAAGSPHSVILSGTGIASYAPVCTLTANPARMQSKRSAVLSVSCLPAATSITWTGGTCADTTAATCTVSPTTTTSYSATGVNSFGSSTASATVTVGPVDLAPILMLLLD
ncbi:MAG: hypothetical protein IPN53_01610 [Comamonadaceae bacterium]|nr:hypothetical protein [Comamonadaceae bacterium]